MRSLAFHRVAVCLALAALPGCATNAIRLESARSAETNGRAAVAAASTYFDAIEQRRREAAAALVASDPSCLPATPLRIQVPTGPDAVQGAPLCIEYGAPPLRGYTSYDVDVGPSPRSILEPRVALLAAVADYADALALILDRPKADVSAEITAFADQVDRLARFTNFVAGTDLPDINAAAATEQGKSLVALIAFADELAREAGQTRDVRALVVAKGVVVDRALASLRDQVTVWGRGATANADDLYGNALFRTYLRNRTSLAPDEREALATRILLAREITRQGPARATAVADAIDLARKAQEGLRAALDGRLSPAQRRAAARLNIDRVTRALGLVASLANPL